MTGIPKLYNCKIMIISILSYRFCIFILSYLLSFLFSPYFYSLGHVLSYNLIHIHICRPKQAESCVGRTKEEWITGTWMKGGDLCYSSWIFCSRITFPCPAVELGLHSKVCHDHGKYFSQWNLSRGDMSLPNRSIIFLSNYLECRYNDRNWNSHIRPKVSSTGGCCDKKEVGLHFCGKICTNIIWKRIEIVLYLIQCYLRFDYSSWTCNLTVIIE